ncbi:MAG: gluconokinase [Verrucomicrobium sp.]|nr:gluconokinase [Verrucomicrobium sp.]
MSQTRTFIIMGVAGSGKSLIGQKFADAIGADFGDGDDFHPEANKAKQAAKIPLTDEDRWPWLQSMRRRIEEKQAEGRDYVLACSALKAVYRDLLRGGDSREALEFVYLKGSKEVIGERLNARKGHFMPPSLLDSQFATLEEPEDAIDVDVSQTPDEIVADIVRAIG